MPYWKYIIALVVALSVVLSGCKLDTADKSELISVTGIMEVVQSDNFDTDTAEIYQVLADKTNRTSYRLKMGKDLNKSLQTGMSVQLTGQLENGVLEVLTVDNATMTPAKTTAEKALTGANGIAVIIVDFQDGAVDGSPEQIASVMFDDPADPNDMSVAGYYDSSSYGQFTFADDSDNDGYQDVFGPFTVSYSVSDPVDYYGWAYEAEAAAEASGVDLSKFKHRLFVVPKNTSAPWWGIANVGISYSGFGRAWITQWDQPDLYAHEIGHNLYLRHASTDPNNDGITDVEYGDFSCIMGYSGVGYRELNAPHRVQMGWFEPYPENVITADAAGTYYIAPLELNPWESDLPQIIRFPKGSTGEYYYLSYRSTQGYNSSLRSDYLNGVNIHTFAGGAVATRYITTLQNGDSFEDAANDFALSQVAYNTDPVTGFVELTINTTTTTTPECTPQEHTARITPTSITAAAGTMINYGVSVTNHDESGCDASVFTISLGLPAGWSASSTQISLTVAANDTETASFNVTAPADAAAGSYVIDALVDSEDGQHGSSYLESLWTIEAAAVAPDDVTTLTATLQRKGSILTEWDAAAGASVYRVMRDSGSGWAQIAETGSLSYKDSDTSVTEETLFSYSVIAVNDQGMTSESGNIATVTASPSTKITGKPTNDRGKPLKK